jgi:hypothetical protein
MPKPVIFIVSAILAAVIVGVLLPAPNIAGAGTAMMCLMIFLTVAFKVIIEFVLRRRGKKHDKDGHLNKID